MKERGEGIDALARSALQLPRLVAPDRFLRVTGMTSHLWRPRDAVPESERDMLSESVPSVGPAPLVTRRSVIKTVPLTVPARGGRQTFAFEWGTLGGTQPIPQQNRQISITPAAPITVSLLGTGTVYSRFRP